MYNMYLDEINRFIEKFILVRGEMANLWKLNRNLPEALF